jgi:hypothetical protein
VLLLQHRNGDNEQLPTTVTLPHCFVLRMQHITCEAGRELAQDFMSWVERGLALRAPHRRCAG